MWGYLWFCHVPADEPRSHPVIRNIIQPFTKTHWMLSLIKRLLLCLDTRILHKCARKLKDLATDEASTTPCLPPGGAQSNLYGWSLTTNSNKRPCACMRSARVCASPNVSRSQHLLWSVRYYQKWYKLMKQNVYNCTPRSCQPKFRPEPA